MSNPNVTLQLETAEAICSALHSMRFDDHSHIFTFVGDTDEGASTWFLLDYDSRRKVRVEVQRSKLANVVNVNVEWPNMARGFKIGRLTMTIDTKVRKDAEVGAQQVVTRVLEISQDVLSGQGLAGKKGLDESAAALAPTREPDEGDEYGSDADE